MTFHIIPWMWAVDGNKTCGISDTVYITDTGCKSFFTLEEDFVVKPGEAARGSAKVRPVPKVAAATDPETPKESNHAASG